ncbi:MAG: guanylate kinase [Nitrospirota bacterium]
MDKKTKTIKEFQGNGELFIVSAPSGAGKTTLCRKLCAIVPQLKYSVSYTTRPRRKGEINNVHYTFISEKKFKDMIRKEEFAEWAVVHGNLYGTSIRRPKELLKRGYDIILDIDVQGAVQMKRRIKDAVYIFVLPPSMKVLQKRLKFRRSDSAEQIKRRLEKAREEILSYRNYDYVIINNKLGKAARELESIILARRLGINRFNSRLIKKLK